MSERRSVCSLFLCFAALAAISLRVEALEPQQLLEKASPSVVTIETLDATGRVVVLGSGVVISLGEIITNCHVVANGVRWRVKSKGHESPAYLRFYDKARDLCRLYAPLAASFARPVRGMGTMDDLRVGQRVYAIGGGPVGHEVTLSDGVVSGLRRSASGSIELIQTTSPVSPGSSGGGLFDQDGRLIGIATLAPQEGQNLNALPASWLLELSSRPNDIRDWRRMLPADDQAAEAEWQKRRFEEELRRRKEQANADLRPPPPITLAPRPTNSDLNVGAPEAALKRYQQDVVRTIGRAVSERDYPRLARDQGWEGSTMVRVEIGKDGLLKDVTVQRSSGFSVLDDGVVSKIWEISLPGVPEELRDREFSVDIPFRFSLRRGAPRFPQGDGEDRGVVPKPFPEDGGVVLPGPRLQ